MSAFNRFKTKKLLVRAIPPTELRLVEALLHRADPDQIKRGLQDICRFYERGLAPKSSHLVAAAVAHHLQSKHVLVRRWAYKAVAHLANSASLPGLYSSFLDEEDDENKTWIVAALFAIETESKLEDWIKNISFFGSENELAARIFARSTFIHDRSSVGPKQFDNVTLVRKWSALLTGYDILLPAGIAEKGQALDLMGVLTTDHDEETIEYAVWALDRHAAGKSSLMRRTPRELIETQGERVKRWAYQVITKTQQEAKYHRELIEYGMAETPPRVRDGLAQGLARIGPFGLQERVQTWFTEESDESVVRTLVDHVSGCAVRAKDPQGYVNALARRFWKSAGDPLTIMKLRAACERHVELNTLLREIDSAQPPLALPQVDANGQSAPNQTINLLLNYGDVTMVGNSDSSKNSYVGGNVTNSALNVDTMVSSLNGAVNGSGNELVRSLAAPVEEFARALASDGGIDSQTKERILASLKDVAESGTSADRKSKAGFASMLLNGLKGAASVAGVGSAIAKLLPLLSDISEAG